MCSEDDFSPSGLCFHDPGESLLAIVLYDHPIDILHLVTDQRCADGARRLCNLLR